MTSPNDNHLPEELVQAEQKPAPSISNEGPSVLGLPGLPASIRDLIVQYLPITVLAVAVLGGFSAVGLLIRQSAADAVSPGGLLPLSAFLGLAASLVMVPTYIWLTQRRRIGWNALALAVTIEFLSQILATGVGSILSTGVAVLIIVYLMLQLRDSYSS